MGEPGYWIEIQMYAGHEGIWHDLKCSKCNKYITDAPKEMIFCPFCGDAKFEARKLILTERDDV